jgi:hypothetical protein
VERTAENQSLAVLTVLMRAPLRWSHSTRGDLLGSSHALTTQKIHEVPERRGITLAKPHSASAIPQIPRGMITVDMR